MNKETTSVMTVLECPAVKMGYIAQDSWRLIEQHLRNKNLMEPWREWLTAITRAERHFEFFFSRMGEIVDWAGGHSRGLLVDMKIVYGDGSTVFGGVYLEIKEDGTLTVSTHT